MAKKIFPSPSPEQSGGYAVKPFMRRAYTHPALSTINEASQSVRDGLERGSQSIAGDGESTASIVHERPGSSERSSSSEHKRPESSEHDRLSSSVHERPVSSVHEGPDLVVDEQPKSSAGKARLSWPLRNHRRSLVIPIEDQGPYRARAVASAQRLMKRLLGDNSSNVSDSDQGKTSSKTDTAKLRKWERKADDELFEVSFAEMQRMKLRKLQHQLVGHAVSIHYDEIEPDTWEHDLKEYTEAVRDYDYMLERGESTEDPFLATSQNFLDHYVIQTLSEGKNFLPDTGQEGRKIVPVPLALKNHSEPIIDVRKRYRARTWTQGFQQRVLMATVGGVFLIGPMWLMVKLNDQTTSLISTTAFVAAFGLLMAYSIDSPEKVMSATAAYAAVLVVFVGLGGTPGDGS
ncbi:hypothetical protein BJ166DRAFT_289475 [Pestalotiopsis sp. NC0098]|nr:hypothetical protein BJ166DRAFT_289475 [Pestalotiopsis sp. NC0098]